MSISEAVTRARRETADTLGLTLAEVAYITDELLAAYADAPEVDFNDDEPLPDPSEGDGGLGQQWA